MRSLAEGVNSVGPTCVRISPEVSLRDHRKERRGTGIFMLRLAKLGVRVVPCAVWRDADGRMHARFGPSICFEQSPTPGKQQRDDATRRLIMHSIACLLPDELQNTYAAEIMQEYNHGQVGAR